jgi:translocation and assembly module TamB
LVDKLNVDVQFAGNKVVVNNVSATLGKGTVSGNGTYALRSSADAAYKFNMQAKNAEIVSNIFRGRINGDVTIAPHTYVINRRAVGSEQTALGYRPFIKARYPC